METITIRPGIHADIAQLDAVFARSYPKLLAPDYAPSVLVTAIPIISRAQPDLVTCGSFFIAQIAGEVVGGGGWTKVKPGTGGGQDAGIGHIRHFVTDVAYVRQGVGGALIRHVLKDAAGAGITLLHCMSTLTAVSFYENAGFVAQTPVTIPLAPGVDFPAIAMTRELAS